MATIACPHCAMYIQLASSAPGKYQCPDCKGILNIANPQQAPKSVAISPNLQNHTQITLPKSYIFWQRAKLFIFTPIGVIFTVMGLMGVIAHRSSWPAVLIFFGLIFFIPAFFYKSDIKHKQTEMALVASNHLLPGQKLVNTNKRVVTWSLIIVFLALFLLAFISVGLIYVAILLVGGGHMA
jgi:phage FluMu protein Com